MPSILDLISLSTEKNPTEFSSVLNDLLHSKAIESISDRKISLTQELYGDEDSSEDWSPEDEDEDEDLDMDDIGIGADEDIDIGIEDFDLSNEDTDDQDSD